jgi:hypothetical protein
MNIETSYTEYIDNKGNIIYIETLTRWRNLLNIKQTCKQWERVVRPILILEEYDKYACTIMTHCEICESLGILQNKEDHKYKYYNDDKWVSRELNGRTESWECKTPEECEYHCFNLLGHCRKGIILKTEVKSDDEYWKWRTKQIELHHQKRYDIANKVYNKREKYFVDYRTR